MDTEETLIEALRSSCKDDADRLGVSHNEEGTEFFGMREDGTAWMCVFFNHPSCVATECICACHDEQQY